MAETPVRTAEDEIVINEAGDTVRVVEHWRQGERYYRIVHERMEVHAENMRTFSKLKLYAALTQAGLWDALVAWLQSQAYEGINAYTAFTLAQDLTDDHPLFAQWLAAAKTALSVSDEQAEAILAASIL